MRTNSIQILSVNESSMSLFNIRVNKLESSQCMSHARVLALSFALRGDRDIAIESK